MFQNRTYKYSKHSFKKQSNVFYNYHIYIHIIYTKLHVEAVTVKINKVNIMAGLKVIGICKTKGIR